MKFGTATYNNPYDLPLKYRYCNGCAGPLKEDIFYRVNAYPHPIEPYNPLQTRVVTPARFNFCSEPCRENFILACLCDV